MVFWPTHSGSEDMMAIRVLRRQHPELFVLGCWPLRQKGFGCTFDCGNGKPKFVSIFNGAGVLAFRNWLLPFVEGSVPFSGVLLQGS